MVKCPFSDPLLPPSPTFCLRDFESKHGGRVFTGEIVAGTRQFMAFAYANVEIALCVPGRSHHYQQVVARTPSLMAFGEIVVVAKVNQYRRHGKTGNPEKSFGRSTELLRGYQDLFVLVSPSFGKISPLGCRVLLLSRSSHLCMATVCGLSLQLDHLNLEVLFAFFPPLFHFLPCFKLLHRTEI
jgi:hypothetical protein